MNNQDEQDDSGCMHVLCDRIFPHDLRCVDVLRSEHGTVKVPGGSLGNRIGLCLVANRRAGPDGPVHVPAHEHGDPVQFLVPCAQCDDEALADGCVACAGTGTVILTMPTSPENLFV